MESIVSVVRKDGFYVINGIKEKDTIENRIKK